MRRLAIVFAVTLLACGGSTFDVGAPSVDDSSVADSAATPDTSKSDTATGDSARADSASNTDVAVGGDTGTCAPFWCGCGACVPADIICTKSMAGCPLGCPAGACPAMEMDGVCTTVGDRCVRNGIAGPIACLTSADCPPGKCCDGTYTPPAHGVCGAC